MYPARVVRSCWLCVEVNDETPSTPMRHKGRRHSCASAFRRRVEPLDIGEQERHDASSSGVLSDRGSLARHDNVHHDGRRLARERVAAHSSWRPRRQIGSCTTLAEPRRCADSSNGNFDGLDSDRDRVTMNDRMTHDIKCGSRFGPDRRLLAAGARHRLPASSTDADNHMPGKVAPKPRSESASHPDLTVVLMSAFDVEDRPAGAADCGAAANLHTESLSPDLLTRLRRAAPLRPILCC